MIYLLCYVFAGVVMNMLSLFQAVSRRQAHIAKILNEAATLKHMPNDRWPLASEIHWSIQSLIRGVLLSLIAWPYLIYRDWNN